MSVKLEAMRDIILDRYHIRELHMGYSPELKEAMLRRLLPLQTNKLPNNIMFNSLNPTPRFIFLNRLYTKYDTTLSKAFPPPNISAILISDGVHTPVKNKTKMSLNISYRLLPLSVC